MYTNNQKRTYIVKHFGKCCKVTAEPPGVSASVLYDGEKVTNPQENSGRKILSYPFCRQRKWRFSEVQQVVYGLYNRSL